MAETKEQKNHAAFVQPAIRDLAQAKNIRLAELDAVAVSAGPGSYTGIRVGLATAKGICYALQKKLVMVNTLEVMAEAVFAAAGKTIPALPGQALVCPMIDARRMEVFTALYTQDRQEIQPPHALILDEGSFTELLQQQPVLFTGSGHHKLKNILTHPQALFSGIEHRVSDLRLPALKKYRAGLFADLAYSDPLYVKEFFSPAPKS